MRLLRLLYLKTYWTMRFWKWNLKKSPFWENDFLKFWWFFFFTIWNCILQQIFVIKQYAFVQERYVLSNSSKCHNKSSAFFLLESKKIWKSDFWHFFQKVAISRFFKSTKCGAFCDVRTHICCRGIWRWTCMFNVF